MTRRFALTWIRSESWAEKLGKAPGRAISNYPSLKHDYVKDVAAHINSINPEMDCGIESYNA